MKAVIFDFNGTLFWDTALHNRAWDRFLENHGIRLTDDEKNVRIHGKMNQDILRGILQREPEAEEMRGMIHEKESIYQALCLEQSPALAPGAVLLLDRLQTQRIPFTIATASENVNLDFYFKHLRLNRWFDRAAIVYNDGSFSGKPAPDIFLLAAEKLGIPVHDTVIFEDSFAGIRAAERAGAGRIIIVNSHQGDYSQWAYPVITDFREVLGNKLLD